MNLSAQLARHVVDTRFDDLPPETIAVAKRSLIDALGVTLAAGTLGQAGGAFVEMARASGHGPSSVIGFGFQAAPSLAALANGALSHALDYEDTHDTALVHPNGTAFPAALAIAQWRGGVSGSEFITAMAVGADITCRLGMAMADDDTQRGWLMRPLLGTYGATAAAGKLLGLDTGQMVQAFALAFNQVTCSSGCLGYAASHIREIRDGFAAQAAVTAAMLASRGVEAYDRPIDGSRGLFAMYAGGRYNSGRLVGGLGSVFEGANVSFKPWPSCRGTHAFVEAALAMLDEHAISFDQIESALATVSPTFRILCEPREQKLRPATANDAKFSVPFTTASALVHGRLSLSSYRSEALVDERVLSLAQRVECVVKPDWGFDQSLHGELCLKLRDGRALTSAVTRPLGDPQNPLSAGALLEKFVDCGRFAPVPIDETRARLIAAAIARLDEARDLSAFSVG